MQPAGQGRLAVCLPYLSGVIGGPGVEHQRGAGVVRGDGHDVVARVFRDQAKEEGAVALAGSAAARDRRLEGEGDVVAGADRREQADVADATGGYDEDVVL